MNTIESSMTVGKQRVEALTDGIFAITLTLLVLELKLPPLPEGASDPMLRAALLEVLPKGLTWLLSFWVMALFWLAQCRLHRLMARMDRAQVSIELAQLALIGLLPFSTALIGEHGSHASAATFYSLHLLLLALLSLLRIRRVARDPSLRTPDWTPGIERLLSGRAWVVLGCTALTLALSFVVPGWNMLAMLPIAASSMWVRR